MINYYASGYTEEEYKFFKKHGKFPIEIDERDFEIANNLICGKCNKIQNMSKLFWGKGIKDFSWWCPNCQDRISQTAVRVIGDKRND